MKSLIKEYKIHASIDEIFEALTDPDIIEEWSGDYAEMDARPGGKFSLWEGSIHGENKEISKNKIVQEWYEEGWEKPSKLTMTFEENNGITNVKLIHINIPDGSLESIKEGWDKYYMGPLIELVEG